MTVPRPDPDDPAALSARERKILADLESELGGEDLVVSCARPGLRDGRARRLFVQLRWFALALMMVMIVGVEVPMLLQPLAVLLTMGAVVHALLVARRLR